MVVVGDGFADYIGVANFFVGSVIASIICHSMKTILGGRVGRLKTFECD